VYRPGTYVSMTYVRIRICILGFMCLSSSRLACIGPDTHLHTHIQCCCTLCYCWHDASGAMSPHVCTYADNYVLLSHESYAGLHMHNDVAAHCATVARCHRYLCTMARSAQNCYVALQTDSSARDTPCAMCTPSNYDTVSSSPPVLRRKDGEE